jgi:hypothetical protein
MEQAFSLSLAIDMRYGISSEGCWYTCVNLHGFEPFIKCSDARARLIRIGKNVLEPEVVAAKSHGIHISNSAAIQD